MPEINSEKIKYWEKLLNSVSKLFESIKELNQIYEIENEKIFSEILIFYLRKILSEKSLESIENSFQLVMNAFNEIKKEVEKNNGEISQEKAEEIYVKHLKNIM